MLMNIKKILNAKLTLVLTFGLCLSGSVYSCKNINISNKITVMSACYTIVV
jgi:hypothetical protein